MAITNTGMQRATRLVINKTVGNADAQGYPHTYNFGDAFSSYKALSSNEIATISVADYRARLAAFKTYVESVEIGVSVNIDDAYRQNLTACPL